MIERLYVHNFRCFQNFTLDLRGLPSALVIGKNGTGKSTLRHSLEVFRWISRGINRVSRLIDLSEFSERHRHIPMRFEIEIKLGNQHFKYTISFQLHAELNEAKIKEESLSVDGDLVFSREESQITLAGGASFALDSGIIALQILDESMGGGSIQRLKKFLASMVLVAPDPTNMFGFSEDETFELNGDASNFSSWLNALLSRYPAAYPDIKEYLKFVLPDLSSFTNTLRGEKGKQLHVTFENEESQGALSPDEESQGALSLSFAKLSDGEKCYFLAALIVASNKFNGPVFCMWDEPDHHLALPQIGHFITQLRKMTNRRSQLIVTSHNPQTIHSFSDENTIVFSRKSHLEPTVPRPLADFHYNGDLIEALVRDEIN